MSEISEEEKYKSDEGSEKSCNEESIEDDDIENEESENENIDEEDEITEEKENIEEKDFESSEELVITNSVKPIVDSKLSKDTQYSFSNLNKGDLLFKKDNNKEFLKIVTVIDRNDPNKFQIKTSNKNEKNDKIIIDANNYDEYGFNKNVKIILVNYLNKVFELILPFNINSSFTKIKKQFCDIYDIHEDVLALIFKDKRLNNKELHKFKLNKDFDFEKDHLLYVQAKSPLDMFKFDGAYRTARFIKESNRKTVVMFSTNIKASSFFFCKAVYQSANVTLKFQIYEIDDSPSLYLNSKKKKFNDDCEKYDFDALFQIIKMDKDEKFKLIYEASKIDCYCNKKDNENSEFSNYLYYKLPNEINFYSDKTYLFNCDVVTSNNCSLIKLKKGRKTYLSDQADFINVFVDKNNKESLLCGVEFRAVTIFEI